MSSKKLVPEAERAHIITLSSVELSEIEMLERHFNQKGTMTPVLSKTVKVTKKCTIMGEDKSLKRTSLADQKRASFGVAAGFSEATNKKEYINSHSHKKVNRSWAQKM